MVSRYTIDELMNELQKIKKISPEKGETIVYIKEIYASDTYLHISDVD